MHRSEATLQRYAEGSGRKGEEMHDLRMPRYGLGNPVRAALPQSSSTPVSLSLWQAERQPQGCLNLLRLRPPPLGSIPWCPRRRRSPRRHTTATAARVPAGGPVPCGPTCPMGSHTVPCGPMRSHAVPRGPTRSQAVPSQAEQPLGSRISAVPAKLIACDDRTPLFVRFCVQ